MLPGTVGTQLPGLLNALDGVGKAEGVRCANARSLVKRKTMDELGRIGRIG